MRSVVACGALAVSLLFSTAASAYEVKRNSEGLAIRWAQESVHLTIDQKFIPRFGRKETEAAVAEAIDAWAGIPGVPQLEVSFGHLPEFSEGERHDGIYWLEEWVTSEDQLALTYTSSTGAGHVVGADVIINGAMAYAHLDEAGRPFTNYDLAAVLTHEFGHVLGLAESDHEEATMHPDIGPGEVFQRTLAQDDRDGIQAVYEEDVEQVASCGYHVSHGTISQEIVAILGLFGLVGLRRRRNVSGVVVSDEDESA